MLQYSLYVHIKSQTCVKLNVNLEHGKVKLRMKTKSATCYSVNKINRDYDDESSIYSSLYSRSSSTTQNIHPSIMSPQMIDVTSDDITKLSFRFPSKLYLLPWCFLAAVFSANAVLIA